MDRRLGRPLPHQLPNPTRAHPVPPEFFTLYHAIPCAYAVLAAVSSCCPPVQGRLPTRYSPVRHSVFWNPPKSHPKSLVRLACVKHAASVHPEPGSNSLIKCVWFGQNNYLAIHSLFTVFKGQFLKNKTFQEFSRLFHCSVIKVLKLFLCCLSTGATLISYHSFFSLSTTFFNFFNFFIYPLFFCSHTAFLRCFYVYYASFLFYAFPRFLLSFVFNIPDNSFVDCQKCTFI